MSLEFKAFVESDVPMTLALYNHYVATSTATFSIAPLTEEEMSNILFSGLERFPSYKIMDDGEFVGYVLMNRYKPREAYDQTAEVTVYLDEKAQGKGIGTQAMTFIEAFAKVNNFRALLGVICAENVESIRLFEKADYFRCAHFKEVGTKFGRLLDVVIYEKLI